MREYESFDALGLAELVRKGEVSANELLDAALERVDSRNPALNAVVFRFEERARARIAAGLPDGPFRGVPFLLKDLYAHLTGTPLQNGSRLWAGHVSDHDAEISARFEDAGLAIFGRTASPELGLTATTESSAFGATRNPWNLAHSSGGSSGGASAAVAAGIVPAAHASDGGGSIRVPASTCGLFGLKPTRARVPSGPDAGEGWSGMSTAHAVTRSVRDSAALLDAIHGADLGAPYAAPAPERPFLAEVGREPGRLRIALQLRAFNGADVHPDCVAAARDAAALCESLGHDVEEAELDVDPTEVGTVPQTVIGANVRSTLDDAAKALGRAISPETVEPITLGMYSNAAALDAAAMVRAVRWLHATGRKLARFLTRYDVLLTPTLACPPLPIGALSLAPANPAEFVSNIRRAIGFTGLYNAAGNPAMSVPLFWNDAGLPIGAQFGARFGDEGLLFRLASQLEQARPWRERRPKR